MNKLNIIIPALGGKGWTGGQIYQENLVNALRTRADVSIYIINAINLQNQVQEKQNLKRRITHVFHQIYLSANYQLSKLILGYDRRLTKSFKQFKAAETNVLFTNNHSYLDIRNEIIKFYWIPDFQHVHLPYLFTEEQIEERNFKFLEGCKKSDVIILSSEDAQKDLAKFAPQYLTKSRISHFAANVNDVVWEGDPKSLITQYNIPEKFFYLPNQFWKHKNHYVVFKALAYLKEKNISLHVVCTGNPSEFRSPEYFNEIKSKIAEWNIEDQIHLLGLLPYDDVLLLMRQCVALLNPSLFEGWSTTVEECKSIGKKAILSDIPVHREQAPKLVDYFPANDHKKLAEIMEKTWNTTKAGSDFLQEQIARQEMSQRIENHATGFFNIIKEQQVINAGKAKAEFETPILFLIFNRPENTFEVFNTIRKMRPSRLFIAADGPRKHVPEDKVRCEKARKIVDHIDWECDVQLLFREKNLSTKTAVSEAIHWFFDNVEEGIILEDDCVASESFFHFCKELLEKYRGNDKIMHINGSNFILGKDFNFNASYYFSALCHPWGWATWKRAWLQYDIEMRGLDEYISSNKFTRITSSKEGAKHYAISYTRTQSGEIDTWDYQWFFTVWKNEGITITPSKNLITNIGYGEDATHTTYKYTKLSKMKRNKLNTLIHPPKIEINKAADEYAIEVILNEGKGNIFQRLVAKIRLMTGI